MRSTDVVIGGWLQGDGGRAGRLGALAIGFYEDGELRYAGKVGTGFTDAELKRLQGLLEPLARDDEPVHRHPAAEAHALRRAGAGRRASTTRDITRIGTLRHPVLQGPARRHRPARRRDRAMRTLR